MMGSRGRYDGDKSDAFSRGSRRIIAWGRHATKAIKRRWHRRRRAKEHVSVRQTARLVD